MAAAKELIGQVLQETYRLERLIGKGGMGSVFEASHTRLSRRFAIKVLVGGGTFSEPEAKGRFQREAEVTSGLRHPNVVETIDFNTTADGAPYIVMELLEGEDLEARLKRINRLPCAKVSAIIGQAAAALQAAHDRGVIHRDLKPSNIFLCRTEEDAEADLVKVVDFGLSKILGVPSALTRTHQVMGSAWYMAPEQVEGETASVDAKTDQFALGAIAYEMLTGRPPFYSKSVSTVLSMVLSSDPAAMSSLGAVVPQAMERAVLRALSKAPADRFETVADLAQAMGGSGSTTADLERTLPPAEVEQSQPFDATLPLPGVPGVAGADPVARTLVQGEPAPASIVRSAAPEPPPGPAVKPEQRRRSAALWIVLGLAALVAVWVGFWVASDDADPVAATAADARAVPDRGTPPPDVPPPPDQGAVDAAADARAPDARAPDAALAPRRKPARTPAKTPRKPAGPAILQVTTLHDDTLIPAAIYLDGVKIGEAPLHAPNLKPGIHVVEARYSGYKGVKRKIKLIAGKPSRLVLRLKR